MTFRLYFLLSLFWCASAVADAFQPVHSLTLWYDKPATAQQSDNIWMEYSLPIGNGQLGACLFGGVGCDEIQFNEKTLWTGGPSDMGEYGFYRNFGSVLVEDLDGGTDSKAADYVRYLDLEEAVGGVDYRLNGYSYSRRYLSSYPDGAIVVRYTTTNPSGLHLRISVQPGKELGDPVVAYAGSDAHFSGKLTTVSYDARLRVGTEGKKASLSAGPRGMEVQHAQEVTLVLVGATNYDAAAPDFVSDPSQLEQSVAQRVDKASKKGWKKIHKAHVKDFTAYMGRVDLQLGKAASQLPTDALVRHYNSDKYVTGREPDVLFLEQLYFAYGRYLEIASSRGVDVPSNLQGIWNNVSQAPWHSDIHSNINVQMNYWPAEPTNLSEMHLPFLNYIINMAGRDNWHRAATEYGKVKTGWTCFTENNIFGGMSTWGNNYFVANAWYCSHLWQHYRFTLDKAFLKRAFPVMWTCAQFWMERMIADRGSERWGFKPDGTYVAPDEFSPEQGDYPKEDGTAHAQQLIYALLQSVKSSVDILGPEVCGLTASDVQRLDSYLEKTDRGLHTETYTAHQKADRAWTNPRNGVKKGETLLREWKYATYDVTHDASHRHISHLMALYPLSDITTDSEYFGPAVNSLKLRGDEATGWSMGWKVCLWARALDGNHAHKILRNALRHSTSFGVNQYAGGVYYNLFDSHAPFQIDGNFGVCAGMAEMLLQSHSGVIQLLPALPDNWQDGHVSGLCAVGNFQVDQQWADARLTEATVLSRSGGTCTLRYKGISRAQVKGKKVQVKVLSDDMIEFATQKGGKYNILF